MNGLMSAGLSNIPNFGTCPSGCHDATGMPNKEWVFPGAGSRTKNSNGSQSGSIARHPNGSMSSNSQSTVRNPDGSFSTSTQSGIVRPDGSASSTHSGQVVSQDALFTTQGEAHSSPNGDTMSSTNTHLVSENGTMQTHAQVHQSANGDKEGMAAHSIQSGNQTTEGTLVFKESQGKREEQSHTTTTEYGKNGQVLDQRQREVTTETSAQEFKRRERETGTDVFGFDTAAETTIHARKGDNPLLKAEREVTTVLSSEATPDGHSSQTELSANAGIEYERKHEVKQDGDKFSLDLVNTNKAGVNLSLQHTESQESPDGATSSTSTGTLGIGVEASSNLNIESSPEELRLKAGGALAYGPTANGQYRETTEGGESSSESAAGKGKTSKKGKGVSAQVEGGRADGVTDAKLQVGAYGLNGEVGGSVSDRGLAEASTLPEKAAVAALETGGSALNAVGDGAAVVSDAMERVSDVVEKAGPLAGPAGNLIELGSDAAAWGAEKLGDLAHSAGSAATQTSQSMEAQRQATVQSREKAIGDTLDSGVQSINESLRENSETIEKVVDAVGHLSRPGQPLPLPIPAT